MRFPILALVLLGRLAFAALPPDDFVPDFDLRPIYGAQPPSGSDVHRRQFRLDQVMQHQGPILLWFDVGPTLLDIVQIPDCWLAAASLAVVLASSDWMTHLFYNADYSSLSGSINPTVADTHIMLWDPTTRNNHFFKTSTFNQSYTENWNATRWWGSAVMQGMMQLSAINPILGVYPGNNTFDEDGGDACAALTALTGYESESVWAEEYKTDDKLYDDLSNAWVYHTPMVILTTTKDDIKANHTNSLMKGSHAYAVMWTVRREDGSKTAVLRNPWGVTVEVPIKDIRETMTRVARLKDHQELDWAKATEAKRKRSIDTERDGNQDVRREEGISGKTSSSRGLRGTGKRRTRASQVDQS